MYMIPAIFIDKLWIRKKCNSEVRSNLLMDFDILCQLIACFDSQYSTDTKSTLRKIFGAVMDLERQHIEFDSLVYLLSDTVSLVISAMRDQIMAVCCRLSTSFNYMILNQLSEFLFSIEYLDTGGMIVND